jgi:1,5-anhydro-D-fructose reductase (1,5-anhydro-D-mannitol-forming)
MRFALLGTGGIADRFLAPALAHVDGAQLWSVLSRDHDRAADFARRHRAAARSPAHTDLDALLADPDLDAVIIATPDALHAPQAIAAARARKHILVEKPMATGVDEGRAMVAAARAAGVRLGVAYHLRFHAGHRALHAQVQAGAIGPVRHVRAQWSYHAKSATNWRASTEVGRWWALAGVGTHCLDLARWLLMPSQGEVVELASVISRAVWKGPNDETAIVALRFAGGATAEIVASVLFDAPTRVELLGADARAVCKGTLGPFGAGSITVGGAPLAFAPGSPYVGELADFVAAVNEERDPEVPGEEGLRNVELLVAAAPR